MDGKAEDTSGEGITVAIRVRPLNAREKDDKQTSCWRYAQSQGWPKEIVLN